MATTLEQAKILVIGLGEIGHANAEYMKSIGLEIDGDDVEYTALRRCLDESVIKNVCAAFGGYDYYLVCVSTDNPHDENEPDLKALKLVLKQIKYEGKRGALIAIESTIPS